MVCTPLRSRRRTPRSWTASPSFGPVCGVTESEVEPVATVPSGSANEDDFPLRIHWRDADIWNQMAGLVSTPVTNANIRSNHPTRTQSLRLRRYLDDHQGLYFQFFDQFVSDGVDSLGIHKWVGGTIYYRWRI